jgi:hypothetical protein
MCAETVTLQNHHNGAWHDAAILDIRQTDRYVAGEVIPKPESSDLSRGLEFDEAVGLKRPNLRRSCRLGLLSPTAVPKRCKRSELSGFGIIDQAIGRSNEIADSLAALKGYRHGQG